MTQVTMESLEASGFEGIIKEGPDVLTGFSDPLPCFVRHRDAGGWCERPASMRAYHMNFCEVHGAEIKAGIMAEIYHDAGNVLDGLYDSEDPLANTAAWVHLDEGHRALLDRAVDAEEAQARALVRAYPLNPDRVDSETSCRDFRALHDGNDDPVDVYMDARMHTHKLMRLSWSVGQDWILEILEEERQGASAQLAFALELRAQQLGQPV